MAHIDRKTKIIMTLLFTVVIVCWNIGFELGAFGTVLYRNTMNAWIFSVATFSALIYFRIHRKVEVKTISLAIIFISILWPLVDYFDQHSDNIALHYFIMFYYILMAGSLGFTTYIFLKLIKYDLFESLNKKNLAFIVFSVILTTFVGFQIGYHHYLFIACGHFKISGEYVPPNCYKHPNPNFRTFYRKTWDKS
jgi:hypothetical protein